jgi:hypothetical protein
MHRRWVQLRTVMLTLLALANLVFCVPLATDQTLARLHPMQNTNVDSYVANVVHALVAKCHHLVLVGFSNNDISCSSSVDFLLPRPCAGGTMLVRFRSQHIRYSVAHWIFIQ